MCSDRAALIVRASSLESASLIKGRAGFVIQLLFTKSPDPSPPLPFPLCLDHSRHTAREGDRRPPPAGPWGQLSWTGWTCTPRQRQARRGTQLFLILCTAPARARCVPPAWCSRPSSAVRRRLGCLVNGRRGFGGSCFRVLLCSALLIITLHCVGPVLLLLSCCVVVLVLVVVLLLFCCFVIEVVLLLCL